jgi:hypothetical protein
MNFVSASCHFCPVTSKCALQRPIFLRCQFYVTPVIREAVFNTYTKKTDILLSPILFSYTANLLPMKLLKGLETFIQDK